MRAELAVQRCAGAAGRTAVELSFTPRRWLPGGHAGAGQRVRGARKDLLVRRLRLAGVHLRPAEADLVHIGGHVAAAQCSPRRRSFAAKSARAASTSAAAAGRARRARAARGVEDLSRPYHVPLYRAQPGCGAPAWRSGSPGVRMHPALPGVSSRADRLRGRRSLAGWLAQGAVLLRRRRNPECCTERPAGTAARAVGSCETDARFRASSPRAGPARACPLRREIS